MKRTMPKTDLTVDDARSKLAGWHFMQEALTSREREILYVAEAVLRELDSEVPDETADTPEARAALDARAVQCREDAVARRAERDARRAEVLREMREATEAVREYDVTLANTTAPGFVWRERVKALDADLARFAFMRRWLGMMISYDVRASELKVEQVGRKG